MWGVVSLSLADFCSSRVSKPSFQVGETSDRSSRCGLVSPPARPHGDFLSALSSDAGKGNEDPKASFDRTTDGAGDL